MNISCQRQYKSVTGGVNARSPRRRGDGGFAVLIVLALLVIIVSLAIGNNVALGHLQSELRLLERRQVQRHESGGGTNAPGSAHLGTATRHGETAKPTLKPAAAP